jgi:hypothetical protein
MRMRTGLVLIAILGLVAIGCGGKENVNLDGDGGSNGNGDGGSNANDGGSGTPDAVVGGACDSTKPQCNNCIDDDEDGFIDGFDPECTGVQDNREDSFETGIPGDNKDSKKQDCFFDGNSGDNCQVPTCCLFADGACPVATPPNFDRATDCAFADTCIAACLPLTPPGCDCFGCCTVCDDNGCYDILTNPAVAPECTQETISDPAKCPVCVKYDTCDGGDCTPDVADCILCPGQDPTDLPADCNGTNTCPDGVTACTVGGAECADTEYCQGGCCVGAIVQ